jgi:hypothetical protein
MIKCVNNMFERFTVHLQEYSVFHLMDLLRYSETKLDICFKDKNRREINDILRQILVHPTRIRICSCVRTMDGMTWVRKTLEFLGAELSNEPSH